MEYEFIDKDDVDKDVFVDEDYSEDNQKLNRVKQFTFIKNRPLINQ